MSHFEYEKESLISRGLYLYMNPLFKRSNKETLKFEDIYRQPKSDSCGNCSEKLRKEWDKELAKRKPKLLNAVWRFQKFDILVSGILVLLENAINTIRPFILQKILHGFENMTDNSMRHEAIYYSLLLILTTFITLFLRNGSFWYTYRMGLKLRVAASGILYRKVLRLNQKSLTATSTGQINNLLSTDAQRFEMTYIFFHYIWVGPLQGIIVFYLMGQITFIPSMCGVAVMLLFIPAQMMVNHYYATLRLRIARFTDARIRIISDVINGIKVIKLHAWEKLFASFVQKIRKLETRMFFPVRICQSFQFTQLVYQIKLTLMALLIAAVWLHEGPGDPEVLRSHQLFTILNYLNALFLSLTLFMPLCVQNLYDTGVSCSRIGTFLSIPEPMEEFLPRSIEASEPSINFSNVCATWNNNAAGVITLKELSFSVTGPRLIAVIGSVGCGKSSLLQAILGELPIFKGSVTRTSSVAYMSQTAWIFPGTVKQNVLFSEPYDEKRYQSVLRATTLDIDIEALQHGDNTQVGERGISLSGGQKARVALARIAYGQSSMVLLDDPLAAVDARVANHLFDKCICGWLSDRLRILVTHQHHLLSKMDKIMVFHEGNLTHFATYTELLDAGVDFESFRSDAVDSFDEFTDQTISDEQFAKGAKRFTNTIKLSNVLEEEPDFKQTQATLVSEISEFDVLPDVQFRGNTNVVNGGVLEGTYLPPASAGEQLQRSLILSNDRSAETAQRHHRSCGSLTSSLHSIDGLFASSDREQRYKRKRTQSSTEGHVRSDGHHMVGFSDPRRRHIFWHSDNKLRSRFKGSTGLTDVRRNSRISMQSTVAYGIEGALSSGLVQQNLAQSQQEEYEAERESSLVKLDVGGNEEETAVAERWESGRVRWKHYLVLGRIGGGLCGATLALIMFVVNIVIYALCDIQISEWSKIVDCRSLENSSNIENYTDIHLSSLPWNTSNNYHNLAVYCILCGVLVVVSTTRSVGFFAVLINSSKQIHNRMMEACLATRLTFFEENPSGRVINRFSKDVGLLDDLLPTTLHDFLQCFFVVLNFGIVTMFTNYFVIIPTVPLLIAFYLTRRYYLNTSRDLKRIESVMRSPVFSWMNVTIQGLPCVRASGAVDYQLRMFDRHVDDHSSVFFVNMAAARWLSLRLDLLCSLFIISVVVVCLLLGLFSTISGGDAGLMITYATGLVGLFQWCVRQSAEVENQMVSVERTGEYMDLKPEVTPDTVVVPPNWPTQGGIVFDGLWLKYNEKAQWALKDIQLKLYPGVKVGVVGRTGAGKSSLISAIFRLVEAEEGRIFIDDVDIGQVDLSQLRPRISIIPQDPIMFSGTVRDNLDPDNCKTDTELWDALNAVQLKGPISTLNHAITEGGGNFSTGERQLLALARAVLGGNRILVVDEATANVDPFTDSIIQKTLRNLFAHCTVLTVAHRLNTVIDNDLIIVMDTGRIVECGPPHELLNPELAKQDILNQTDISDSVEMNRILKVTGTGPLACLVKQTGPDQSSVLAQIARNAFVQSRSK